jgi:hypothetical protein
MMPKWICQKKCFVKGRMWVVGEVYSGAEAPCKFFTGGKEKPGKKQFEVKKDGSLEPKTNVKEPDTFSELQQRDVVQSKPIEGKIPAEGDEGFLN